MWNFLENILVLTAIRNFLVYSEKKTWCLTKSAVDQKFNVTSSMKYVNFVDFLAKESLVCQEICL